MKDVWSRPGIVFFCIDLASSKPKRSEDNLSSWVSARPLNGWGGGRVNPSPILHLCIIASSSIRGFLFPEWIFKNYVRVFSLCGTNLTFFSLTSRIKKTHLMIDRWRQHVRDDVRGELHLRLLHAHLREQPAALPLHLRLQGVNFYDDRIKKTRPFYNWSSTFLLICKTF